MTKAIIAKQNKRQTRADKAKQVKDSQVKMISLDSTPKKIKKTKNTKDKRDKEPKKTNKKEPKKAVKAKRASSKPNKKDKKSPSVSVKANINIDERSVKSKSEVQEAKKQRNIDLLSDNEEKIDVVSKNSIEIDDKEESCESINYDEECNDAESELLDDNWNQNSNDVEESPEDQEIQKACANDDKEAIDIENEETIKEPEQNKSKSIVDIADINDVDKVDIDIGDDEDIGSVLIEKLPSFKKLKNSKVNNKKAEVEKVEPIKPVRTRTRNKSNARANKKTSTTVVEPEEVKPERIRNSKDKTGAIENYELSDEGQHPNSQEIELEHKPSKGRKAKKQSSSKLSVRDAANKLSSKQRVLALDCEPLPKASEDVQKYTNALALVFDTTPDEIHKLYNSYQGNIVRIRGHLIAEKLVKLINMDK